MKAVDPKIQEWLDKTKAVLKRDKKHLIYEFPNGQKVTLAHTSANFHNVENSIHDIKKASGWVEEEIAPIAPSRRRTKPGRFEVPVKQLKADLREALIAKEAFLKQSNEKQAVVQW